MDLKRIGLLGGSFDPVHLAHIQLAQCAYTELALDAVELIPAASPWQRAPLAATSAQRLDMLRLAIQNFPGLRINTLELERSGSTYTIDTLEALPRQAQYFWILGADQLANFCSWHRWEEIIRLVDLVVADRPGASSICPGPLQQALAAEGRHLVHLPFQATPVAASDIRHRLSQGLSVKGLIDPAVAKYIQENNLYHATRTPRNAS